MTIKQEAINIIDEKLSDLCDELKDYLEEEVREDLRDELEDEVRADLRDELEDEVRADLRDELEDEVRADLRDELEDEVRADLREDLKDEISNTISADNIGKIEKWLNKESVCSMIETIKNELQRANYKPRVDIKDAIQNALIYSINLYNVDDITIFKQSYKSWSLNMFYIEFKIHVFYSNGLMIDFLTQVYLEKVQDNVKNEQ